VQSWFVDEQFEFFVAHLKQDDLNFLAELARQGKMTSVIDRRFPLGEVPAAVEYLAGWHARGKVVVIVDGSSQPEADSAQVTSIR
jgi:NADPH:quinone reductase-like Zn-dependent oxidoreductase